MYFPVMPSEDVEIEAVIEKITVKDTTPEEENNPPTSDMNITFLLAAMLVAGVAVVGFKKIKTM